jgi:hypothetical protein
MFANRKVKTVIGALSALALAGFFAGATLAQGPPVNIKQGKFETAEQRNAMKAFRQRGGPKTDAEVKQLGEKLFAHARAKKTVELKEDTSGHLTHVDQGDPSAHFRIDRRTGDFSFNKGLKGYLNDSEPTGLPRGDKAVEMAKKHLGDLGLMPEKQEEMVVRHIGGLRQVDIGPDGKAVERDKLVTVHFGRRIDGVNVGGPGSKIVVELGANGELVGLHRRWIEVVKETKQAGDFAAEAEVRTKINDKLKSVASKAKKISSDAPDFGYFDDGVGNIEPAYFYDAELTYDLTDEEDTTRTKEHKEKYHGAVPALKRSKAKFDQLDKAKMPPRKNQQGDKDSPPIKD